MTCKVSISDSCLAAFLRLSAALLESEVLGFDLPNDDSRWSPGEANHNILSKILSLETELCAKCSTRCVKMILILAVLQWPAAFK